MIAAGIGGSGGNCHQFSPAGTVEWFHGLYARRVQRPARTMSEPKRIDAGLPATVISVGPEADSARIPAPPDSLPMLPSGQQLGRYRILGLLGAGGMGNVYRALDTELDDIVALKMLRHDLADQGEVVERFRREVKLARRVTHRNIARVFDIGEVDGEKFLTMELIEGPTLAEVLATRRVLSLEEAVDLAAIIAAGLGAAHAAGVVHLNLKPGNVLIERGGRVVLSDFGIARALAEAHATDGPHGTPGYMAPEQVAGLVDVDGRADLHALGALLYELLAGKPPWAGEAPHTLMTRRRGSPPPDLRRVRAEVPEALAAIVLRALAFAPEDCFATAADFAQALADVPLPRRAGGPFRTEAPEVPAESELRRITLTNEAEASGSSRAPVLPPSAQIKAVAVLPFRNSGPADDEYLAEELTDDLIDALSMTPGIRVSSRGVVARYRAVAVDPRDVGRALNVQVVAEGTVRRGGGRVRVSARLVSVEEGFQLWAKRFDRPEEEVLAVNEEAARAIATALSVELPRLSRTAPPGNGAARAPNAGAIDLYIRARNRYRRFWPEHVTEAIALFEEAAALAPFDPAILGGLALARTRLSYFSSSAIPAALEAGRRAVAANAAHGEPHLALGSTLLNAGRTAEGMLELGEAVALSPVLAEAHAALGRALVETGDLEEGTRRLGFALDLDPEVPLAIGALLRVHALAGDWTRARALLDRSRATDGELGYLFNRARLAAWQGDSAEAASLLGATAPFGYHGDLPKALIEVVARGRGAGGVPDVTALPHYAEGSLRAQSFFWQVQAEACSFGGDRAGALAALERADACELGDRLWIEHCPLFDDLRGEPRFLEVASSIVERCRAAVATYRERAPRARF